MARNPKIERKWRRIPWITRDFGTPSCYTKAQHRTLRWFVRMMKALLAGLFILAAVGCDSPTYWAIDYHPITEQERRAVDAHVQAVLCATKHDLSVSGHDQDWDDYAAVVYREARHSLCKPRVFEFLGGTTTPTGRWRELSEAKEVRRE